MKHYLDPGILPFYQLTGIPGLDGLIGTLVLALIVVVIGAAELGVQAWVIGMFAVLLGAVLVTTGVLLGTANLVRRHSRTIPA